MSNRSKGNAFEAEFCEILAKNGFWVHNMAQNAAGQPADVIAVRSYEHYLIDCKVCQNNKFSVSRIEPNQHHAMRHWKDCTDGVGWFALKLDSGIYMISYPMLCMSKRTILTEQEIKAIGIPLERWVNLI